MSYQDSNGGTSKTVCVSDRQLSLRAKLQTGWSSSCKRVALNEEEQQAILSVIKRNEQIELVERERVSRLVERVDRIKQRASYYGPKNCSLCGQSFGFGLFLNMTHKHICMDCKKPVCSHCSVDIPSTSSPSKKNICLCHVCSEIRDVWKKTGAWFYKGLPNMETSKDRSENAEKLRTHDVPIVKKSPKTTKLGMEIDSDEDDDEIDCTKEEPKVIKNGSFSSGFLRNRNLFNLRLSTDSTSSSSRLMINDNCSNPSSASPLPKKSPITPYSRQTSSSDSQKSANSLQQPQIMMSENCWESGNPSSHRRRNSISSCYSITTEMGNESISISQNYTRDSVPLCLGWLEVSLRYEESQDTLYCTVLRARDLAAVDAQGLSDPFCKINIITEDTIRHTRWQKTRIAHRSVNPEFNEAFTFIGMSVEDISNSQLYVVILDDDKYGNDFLGAAKITLGPILNCGPCRITCPLGAEDKFSMESLSALPSNGQILIAICYNTQKRALVVVIKRCINLIAMDKNGFSDAFVKLQLDSNRKKYKTAIKWRNLNPVFNEEFSFETPINSLDKQTLIITVWDKDIGKSNDFLGCLVLGEQTSKGRRLKQWRDCLLLPDQYHEKWHSLSPQLPPNHF